MRTERVEFGEQERKGIDSREEEMRRGDERKRQFKSKGVQGDREREIWRSRGKEGGRQGGIERDFESSKMESFYF